MSEGRLLRILGPGFGLAVALGAAIGGEILRLPGSVAKSLPSPSWQLLAWGLGGLNALLGAAVFAELQTRVPRSGGLTVFAAEGLGPFGGWLVGWVDWIASAGTIGAFALLFGEIASKHWAFLRPVPVAAGAVLFVGAVQWRSIRWGSLAQDLESVVKLLPLILLALAGSFLTAAPAEPSVPATSGAAPLAFFTALPLVIFAYDNYYAPVYFGEEFENPRRAVPRALFLGVAVLAGIYLTLAFAMGRALPHAVLAGSELPGADLAARLLGEGGRSLLQLLMLVSLLSCMNATTLLGSRVLFALGRDRRVGRVNEGGTPAPALALTLALASVFLLGGGFEKAVAFMAPFILLNYALCFAALLRLRRRPGDGHFQAWAWTPWAAMGVALALLAGSLATEPRLALGMAGGLALAWPLYALTRPGGS